MTEDEGSIRAAIAHVIRSIDMDMVMIFAFFILLGLIAKCAS